MSELFEARRRQAAEATAMLYEAGARRVWIFGSIARQEVRDMRSDLDLAVEGMSDAQVQAMRSALRAHFRCKVDVVSMERAIPELRQGILKCRILMRPGDRPPPLAASATRIAPPAISSLNDRRYASVLSVLQQHAPRRILDLGCGPGRLIEQMARLPSVDSIMGVDSAPSSIALARRRLGPLMRASQRPAVRLQLALATNPDPRFLGHDAVVAVEMIEHLDPPRLRAFGQVVFDYLEPHLIVITTPNREFNARWRQEGVRERDHRFEWTREEFRSWLAQADRSGKYEHRFDDIGTALPGVGGATQMAVCVARG